MPKPYVRSADLTPEARAKRRAKTREYMRRYRAKQSPKWRAKEREANRVRSIARYHAAHPDAKYRTHKPKKSEPVRASRKRTPGQLHWAKEKQRDLAVAREMTRIAWAPPVNNTTLSDYYRAYKSKHPTEPVPPPDWCSPMRWRMFGQWLKNRERFVGAGESLDCLDKKDVLFLWR